MKEPTPGSLEAVEHGCQCPVMDNARGKGVRIHDEIQFWISSSCPLHSQNTEKQNDR